MRAVAILPLLCAIAAFILSMLCLFAGNHPGFIEDAALLTLNASQLGEVTANTTKPSSTGPFASIESEVVNGIENAGNHLVSDVTHDLGLHDFYSAHLMTYCEGSYQPNATASGASENVTFCSNASSSFWFDPAAIISSELKSGISLSDIRFPQAIEDDLAALHYAFNATFIIYCIGIGFTGLLILLSLVGFFTHDLFTVLGNVVLAFVCLPSSLYPTFPSPSPDPTNTAKLAFIFIGIASAIITVVVVKASNSINSNGNDIGLYAYRGSKYLAMTWSATALLFLASVSWCFGCCFERHRNGYSVRRTHRYVGRKA
ncbi:MAG: hypothetical protein M1838_000077 [Thelocarpon superellum]|nr:MAG: hypothetical protein M1838_000077 [Thelocarpon superellum]